MITADLGASMVLRITLAVLFAGLIFSPATSAQDDNLSFRGFTTIGLTHSNNDSFKFRRNLSRTAIEPDEWSFEPDSLIGIQADYELNNQWHLSAQAVYKNRIEQSLDNSLEWGYIRYQPNFDSPVSFRLGRLGVDVFMLSEYRNVGFAYLWARPPVEFYSPLGFDSLDGADITYGKLLGDGYFQAKLALGYTKTKFNYDEAELDVSPGIATSVSWEQGNWKTRFGYARVRLDKPMALFTPLRDALTLSGLPEAFEVSDNLDLTGKVFNYYSLGLAYDNNEWLAQAEYNRVETKDNIFTPSHAGYLSIGKRIDNITIYGLASFIENTESIYQLPSELAVLGPLATQTQEFYNATGVDQRSWGLGLRWDLHPSTALKVQWDRVWIKPHGAGLWGKEFSNTSDETTDVLSLNLNYIF